MLIFRRALFVCLFVKYAFYTFWSYCSPEVDEEGLQIILWSKFCHLNSRNLLFETDITPLEVPVLPVPFRQKFNIWMKDIFKVAFALLFTWRSCSSSWDIFSYYFYHRDWLMNVYLPLWTHWWVLSPTFLFFPTCYSYFYSVNHTMHKCVMCCEFILCLL